MAERKHGTRTELSFAKFGESDGVVMIEVKECFLCMILREKKISKSMELKRCTAWNENEQGKKEREGTALPLVNISLKKETREREGG